MARCQHYDVCEREHEGIPEGGLCILHSRDPDKDPEAFEEALRYHQKATGDCYRLMAFPKDSFFRGYTFEEDTDFSDVTFQGDTAFKAVTFKGNAYFNGTTFRGYAPFWDTDFKKNASFSGAAFGGNTNFNRATFEGEVFFSDATFKGKTLFREVTFEKKVSFTGTATFEGNTSFGKATFEGETDFRGATFKGKVFFSDVTFGNAAQFEGCRVLNRVTFAGPSEKERIFAGVEVNFRALSQGEQGRLLFRYADLSRCQFLRTDLRQVDFEGVKWCEDVAEGECFARTGVYDEIHGEEREGREDEPEKSEAQDEQGRRWYEIERLYRQLKKNYEERGDYPRAGDFHIGEKQAQRKNPETKWGRWGLLMTYRLFSKYGERALPAFACLFCLVLGCGLLYWHMGITPGETKTPLDLMRAFLFSARVSMLAEGTEGISHLGAQTTHVLQSILSPVLLALFVLALRQQLKR